MSRSVKGLVCLVLLGLIVFPGFSGAKKKAVKKAADPGTIAKVVDTQADAVQGCAVEHGVNKGAKKIDLSARLVINDLGQLFSCDVTAALDHGEGKPLEACVDKVLRGLSFPKSKSSLTEYTRHWSFQIE